MLFTQPFLECVYKAVNKASVVVGYSVVLLPRVVCVRVLIMYSCLQIEMGSLTLLAGWEATDGALQTLGIDMFAQAKQASDQGL